MITGVHQAIGQLTYVVTVFWHSIQVVRLLEHHMGIGDDPGIVLVVVAVGMWEKTVQDKDVAGLRLNGHEIAAVLNMLAEHGCINDGIEAFGMGIKLLAKPCGNLGQLGKSVRSAFNKICNVPVVGGSCGHISRITAWL